MNWLKAHFLRSRAIAILLLGFVQLPAQATGTASGTIINDVATLNYFSGGVSAEVLSSPTAFTVSSKINAAVTAVGSAATNVTSGQVGAVATFSVTNTGNTPQDYALDVSNLGNGVALFTGVDNFDATDCKVFVETNGLVGCQPGEDTATFIDELQQDTSKAVYVVCNIPTGQAGSEAVISLTATPHTGLTVGVLGGNVAGNDEATNEEKYSARNAYLLAPGN